MGSEVLLKLDFFDLHLQYPLPDSKKSSLG